jgi:farnesyl-diphosphate farnesyltransferase
MLGTLTKSWNRPHELRALVHYVLEERRNRKSVATRSTSELVESGTQGESEDTLARCYYYLDRTSRSFAAVIKALHPQLKNAICIFYLALRGLDTIEDDMTIPLHRKLEILLHFHEYLATPGWNCDENAPTDKHRDLLVEFHVVIGEFLKLPSSYQEVIADITHRMAKGMAQYCQRAYDTESNSQPPMLSLSDSSIDVCGLENSKVSSEKSSEGPELSGNRVQTNEEYDLYCHYVAGLVGHGLTRLFLASKLESAVGLEQNQHALANSMGLFLQKINIIRDFHEDFHESRAFWPKEIWGNYAMSLIDLLDGKVPTSF